MSAFYFSVDLEEFGTEGPLRATPLSALVRGYLDLLDESGSRCTFFVVGEIAQRFPDIVREVSQRGHELACHTFWHRPLDTYQPSELRADLERNLDVLRGLTDRPVQGFRAPILSLTPRTAWAYEVLSDLGFLYSSSVLDGRNPLYGWPGFGDQPKVVQDVLEIPITRVGVGQWQVPLASGTYFRCLPWALTRMLFRKKLAAGLPIIGYFHPYDIDAAQPIAMSSGVNNNPFLNALLFVNRKNTLPRLRALLRTGIRVAPMGELARHLSERPIS